MTLQSYNDNGLLYKNVYGRPFNHTFPGVASHPFVYVAAWQGQQCDIEITKCHTLACDAVGSTSCDADTASCVCNSSMYLCITDVYEWVWELQFATAETPVSKKIYLEWIFKGLGLGWSRFSVPLLPFKFYLTVIYHFSYLWSSDRRQRMCIHLMEKALS